MLTTRFLDHHLPHDLVNLVLHYFQSIKRDTKHKAIAGEWESVQNEYPDEVFRGACRGNHFSMIHFPLHKVYYSVGLNESARGGHLHLVQWFLIHGNLAQRPLYEAARCGHVPMIHFLISNSNTNWNHVLIGACRGGHVRIAKLAISRGAYVDPHLLYCACDSGSLPIVQFLIDVLKEKISSKEVFLDYALKYACERDRRDIVVYLIDHGATNANHCLIESFRRKQYELCEVLIAKHATHVLGCLRYAIQQNDDDAIKIALRFLK